MNRFGLTFLFLAIIIVVAGCSSKKENAEIGHINTQELEQRLSQAASEEAVFIDVREPDEFEAGHIEGMLNMPLSTLKETYSQLPQDKEIVIICRSGNRSMQAAALLLEQGYTKVVNVDGGMLAWKGPVVKPE